MKIAIGFFALVTLSATTAAADNFFEIRCAFKADSFQGGKSNDVSCSMSPEIAFSTGNAPHPANQMCSQNSNAFQDNYENYIVDLTGKTIQYDVVLQVADFAKPAYIQQLISRGKSKDKATAEAEDKVTRHFVFTIDQVDKVSRQIVIGLAGQRYDPPKEIQTYIIRYGEQQLHYAVGVPEASIIEFTGDERNSWVNMRFGVCQS